MDAFTFFHSGSHDESERRTTWFRWMCFAAVLPIVVVGVGLSRQSGWATSLWPWPDVRMTYIFLASIAASIAAPVAWAAWRNEPGALDVIAFELMIGAPAVGGYLLWLAFDWRDRDIALFGIGFLAIGISAAMVYRLTRGIPIKNPRRLPTFFRCAFVVICAILIVLGSMCAFQRPDVFPWDISPETSTVIGLIFLSAALLFALIVARPMWAYGEMALTAFIAYDIVLLFPYIDLLRNLDDTVTLSSYYGSSYGVASTGSGVRETNLIVYISVLAITSLLTIFLYAWGILERRRGVDLQHR